MIQSCNYCGLKFQSSAISAGEGSIVTIVNSSFTESCPRCRKMVTATHNGRYQFDQQGIAHLLTSPEFTPRKLHQLRELALTAKERKYSQDQFGEEAKKITPAASGLTKFLPQNFGDLMTFLTVLAAAITTIIAVIDHIEQDKGAPTTINNYNTNNFYNTNN